MSDRAHEIIIIKRHGDHEEGHHGGAWKIALADFMTAMMALFLVMWLINSTSKEQKQTIA
jgi:chemotaxis protein MotB